MSYVVETMTNLAAQTGFAFLKPGNFIMILVALVFLYLASPKDMSHFCSADFFWYAAG